MLDYLGIKVHSLRGGGNRHKKKVLIKGTQATVVIDRCLTKVPRNTDIKTSENIYDMACESKMMYGIEIFELGHHWIESDKT